MSFVIIPAAFIIYDIQMTSKKFTFDFGSFITQSLCDTLIFGSIFSIYCGIVLPLGSSHVCHVEE